PSSAVIDGAGGIVLAGTGFPDGVHSSFYLIRVLPDVSTTPRSAVPVCGNGVIDSGEECDDGNTDAGDGCSPTCQIEPDLDGDGFPDPRDGCVNIGGAQTFSKATLNLAGMKNNQASPFGVSYSQLSFSATVHMPADFSFAAFNPNWDPVAQLPGVTF